MEDLINSFYNKEKENIQKIIENELNIFIKKFPKDKLSKILIKSYWLGGKNSKDSFSYYLEYGTTNLGSIKGGSSKKFRYYEKGDGNLYYYNKLGKTSKEALEKICNIIEKIANETDIIKLQELKEEGILTDLVFNKIAYIYHPNTLLPIYSFDDLKEFAEEFDVDIDKNIDYFTLNKKLLEKLYLIGFGDNNKMEIDKILSIMWFLYRENRDKSNVNIKEFFEGEIKKATEYKNKNFIFFIIFLSIFILISLIFTYLVNINDNITITNYILNYGLIILIEIFLIKFSLHFFNNYNIYTKIEYIYGYYKVLISDIDNKYSNDIFNDNNTKDDIRKQLSFELFKIPDKIENLYNGKNNNINNIIDDFSKIQKIIGK